jgi:hypothetical protein
VIARSVLLAICVVGGADAIHAQTPRAGSWEVSGGYTFVSGYDFDSSDAELTRNTTTGDGFVLFITDSAVEAAHSIGGQLGYYFSPRWAVEGGVRFGKPVFRMELSDDAEGAPDTVVEDTLDQYLFSASVVYHFAGAGRSVLPFVAGGASYLRELHEGQELVETGAEYHASVGIKNWFGNARRRFGLRAEGGLSFRDGGFDFEEKVRLVPTFGVSLVYLF